MRAVGRHPENHECACFRRAYAALDGAGEGVVVGDHVIRRREQNQCLFILLSGNQRGNAGGGRRIAAGRLEHDGFRRGANLLELLGDEEAVAMVGEDGKRAERRAAKPSAGLLEQRFRPDKPMKLLGEGLAR